MKHRTAIFLVAAALLLCGVYGIYRLLSSDSVQTTDDAYVRADSVFVSSRVSGQVAKVWVEDDEAVQVGQPLVELDDRDFAVARAAAAAGVQGAEHDGAQEWPGGSLASIQTSYTNLRRLLG